MTVTVEAVQEQELPEADDDFAQLASEFDTIDELKDDLREQVAKDKQTNQVYAAATSCLRLFAMAQTSRFRPRLLIRKLPTIWSRRARNPMIPTPMRFVAISSPRFVTR